MEDTQDVGDSECCGKSGERSKEGGGGGRQGYTPLTSVEAIAIPSCPPDLVPSVRLEPVNLLDHFF
jgi:hypothetical protein